MLLREFLETVITGPPEGGYFCLALKGVSGWLEEWHHWPQDIDKIIARAMHNAPDANVYFSTYLFKAPQSTRDNVLPTRTIQADLDDADVSALPIDPTILVETSPGRHQGYWILEEPFPSLEDHEVGSRKLTYSIPLCDRSGWPLGRKVRVPETINHKYLSGPKSVHVVKVTGRKPSPEELEALPEVPQFLVEHFDPEFLENPVGVNTHPLELLDTIKDGLPTRTYIQYSVRQQDRSAALWSLMCHAFKAGYNRHQVFSLAKGSANNKFEDLAYRADQDLAKDVLRAEYAVNSNQQDERATVNALYKNQLTVQERKRQIFRVVLSTLKAQGDFFHTINGYEWYVRRDVGRPILLAQRSQLLHTLLDIQFGLNATEVEANYVLHGLIAYANNLPDTAVQAALSHYIPEDSRLLLHTGSRLVLNITPDGIEHAADGAYNVVFPWPPTVEAFMPAVARAGDLDWGEELFGNGSRGYGSSVENLTNVTPEQGMALLKVWFLFLLLRNAANSRPIIAAFGAPGSGKSMLFKKIYMLLYGRYKAIGAVTTTDAFDHATATDPLYIMDNVDTWERWLPDRLALSAGVSDVMKRKLYTDADTVTLRRQAMVGVTAHNPKFGREDVADRFLLFTSRRFSYFVSEEAILVDIMHKRNILWGAVVRDIQKVLRTPMPTSGIPQFRIEDFARFGTWIARAIGVEAAFTDSIKDVRSAQQAFSLEEDGMLVAALMKYVDRPSTNGTYRTAAQLWATLEACAEDQPSFSRIYRNSVALAKKLAVLQPALESVLHVEQTIDRAGTRKWLIQRRDDERSDDR